MKYYDWMIGKTVEAKEIVPTTSWFYHAWIKEESLRIKYRIAFIISTIVNLIMFGVLVT